MVKLVEDSKLYQMHRELYIKDTAKNGSNASFGDWAFKHYENDPETFKMLIKQHNDYEVKAYADELNYLNSNEYRETLVDLVNTAREEKTRGPTQTQSGIMQKFRKLVNNPSVRRAGKVAGAVTGVLLMIGAASTVATQHADAQGSGSGPMDYDVKDISNDPSHQDGKNAIYGDSIVWIKEQSVGRDLIYKNVTSGETKILQDDKGLDQNSLDISGTNIVFIKSDSGSPKVYIQNVESGLEKQLSDNTFLCKQAKIDGKNVVYSQETTSKYIIILNKTVSGEQIEIKEPGVDLVNPDIFGSKIVYQLDSSSAPKVKIYDTTTGLSQNISDEPNFNQQGPRIWGDYVVFSGQYDGGNWDIFIKNIKTNELKKISTDGSGGDGDRVDINDGKVIWSNSATGDLCVYDITEAKIIANEKGNWPSISKDKFTFESSISGDPEVYLATEKAVVINHPPSLEDITDQTVAYGAGWTKPIVASDPDSDPLTILVEGAAFEKVGSSVKLKDSYKTIPGTYLGKVTADDGKGGKATDFFNITVKDQVVPPPVNHAPILSGIPGQYEIKVNDSWQIDLSKFASDQDGDKLAYKAISPILEDKGNGVFGLKAGTKAGTYAIKVNVTDEHGLGAEYTTNLIIKDTVIPPDPDPDPQPSGLPWYMPVVGGVAGLGAAIGGLLFWKRRKNKDEEKKNGRKPVKNGRTPVA